MVPQVLLIAGLVAQPSSMAMPERFDYLGDGPPHADMLEGEPRPQAAGPHVLYVNFDGVTLEGGAWQDDATQNQTVFPDLGGTWPPFGAEPGSAIRESVLAAVRADYDGLALEVTDERPAAGVYTMVVVSPQGAGGTQLGVANVGCGGWNLAGIGFAFHSASSGDATKIGTTIAHEAAHTLGLEHTSDSTDTMYPTYTQDGSFLNACLPLVDMVICGDVHAQHCPAGQQNGHAELAALFGTGEPDASGPTLEIVSPFAGERFASGATVDVDVEAEDDTGLMQVKLFRGDALVGTDVSPPYGWTLEALPDGVHDLQAIAYDVAGNEAQSEVVTFVIGDAELPGETETDGDPTGDMGSGTDDGWEPGEQEGGAEGCGCRQTTSPPWICGLLLLPLTLRRRRG